MGKTEVAQLFRNLKKIVPVPHSLISESDWEPNLTNFIFRLHSYGTCIFLLLCSVLVFAQQLNGSHMKCLLPPEEDMRNSAVTSVHNINYYSLKIISFCSTYVNYLVLLHNGNLYSSFLT